MIYEITKDSNIIKKIETVESEIHLDKLKEQIKSLEDEIKAIPTPKEKPDQETLDFYNMQIGMGIDKKELENQLKEKNDLLNILKGVVIWQ